MPKRYNELLAELGLPEDQLGHIIDATEIFSETASCPMANRSMWSSYKHHSTHKLLGDMTPTGAWNFVSDAYGGRITDTKLIETCGWLKILESDSITLADRGFAIKELIDALGPGVKNHKLVVPAKRTSTDEEFSAEQIDHTSLIARARVHIERAFARVKQFRFFNQTVSISQADLIGKIFYVVAMLTHYMRPLVSDKIGKNRTNRSKQQRKQEKENI